MLRVLGNQLIVAEKVLDGLLLTAEFVFENFYFGFKFDIILFDLVIQNFHLDSFLIELLLFLGLQSVLRCFRLDWPVWMREGNGKTALAHH